MEPYFRPTVGMVIEFVDPPHDKATVLSARKAVRRSFYHIRIRDEIGQVYDSVSSCWKPFVPKITLNVTGYVATLDQAERLLANAANELKAMKWEREHKCNFDGRRCRVMTMGRDNELRLTVIFNKTVCNDSKKPTSPKRK